MGAGVAAAGDRRHVDGAARRLGPHQGSGHRAHRRARRRRAEPADPARRTMSGSRVRVIAAVAVVIAIAVVGAVVRPTAYATRLPRAGVAPVATTTRVCPSVTGGNGGLATDMTIAAVGSGAVTSTYASLNGHPTLHPTQVSLRPSHVVHQSAVG